MDEVEATFAVIPSQRKLSIRQESLRRERLQPDNIAVVAEASVVSTGTELAIYDGIAPGVHEPGSWNAYPWRPGYGLVGHVDSVGSAVRRFAPGDRVFCFGRHASYQFYDVSERAPRNSAFVIDDPIDPRQLTVLRMPLIALSGVQTTTVEAGDTVCVFGLGLVGNLAAQLYQLSGARVVALDPVSYRCEIARQAGIETVINAPIGEQIDAVLDHAPHGGVQIAVDAVGHTSVIEKCIAVCAAHGQVLLLGSPRSPFQCNATELFRSIHLKWLSVQGALEWRFPARGVPGVKHSIESNLRMLMMLLEAGTLKVEPLVSHVIAPVDMPAVYSQMSRDRSAFLGVVVDWRHS